MAGKETAAPDTDWHEEVERCSKMYSIDQWMQPRSMVQVQLAKLKEETRCPMCFGKIRSARISMVCLHRYCAKCIEQYLRAKVPGRHGDDKECPVCRAHLHSRRATKPDPMFDKIIKALYGDVDQYDAEEEELIAQDNKAHVAAWQAQLADMKARQAAAVAAARAASGLLPGSSSGVSPAAAGAAASADGALRPASAFQHCGSGAGAAAGGGGGSGGGGLGSRKRSLPDLQRQTSAKSSKLPRLGPDSVDDMDEDGCALIAQYSKADRAAGGGGSRRGSGQLGSGRLPSGKLGSPAGLKRETSSLAIAAAAAAEASAGGKKKKKPSARQVAAQLLGVAARAAAAAPQQASCCLIHLLPANRQAGSSSKAAGNAAAPAASREGRGRKQPSQHAQLAALRLQQQWQEGGQRYSAPDVDQPYLTCPMELTVGCLKELLMQQLRQQGAAEWSGQQLGELQLLLMQEPAAADAEVAAVAEAAAAAAGVLSDGLTVAQLYERWWGVGPEVQVQYRLLLS